MWIFLVFDFLSCVFFLFKWNDAVTDLQPRMSGKSSSILCYVFNTTINGTLVCYWTTYLNVRTIYGLQNIFVPNNLSMNDGIVWIYGFREASSAILKPTFCKTYQVSLKAKYIFPALLPEYFHPSTFKISPIINCLRGGDKKIVNRYFFPTEDKNLYQITRTCLCLWFLLSQRCKYQ